MRWRNDPRLIATAERLRRAQIVRQDRARPREHRLLPEHRHAWHSDVARDDGTGCGKVW
jgi:hypothetical protein